MNARFEVKLTQRGFELFEMRPVSLGVFWDQETAWRVSFAMERAAQEAADEDFAEASAGDIGAALEAEEAEALATAGEAAGRVFERLVEDEAEEAASREELAAALAPLNLKVADVVARPSPATETPGADHAMPARIGGGAETAVVPDAWSDDDLAEAFRRIEAGEALRDVAASFDKSWHVLRGKWTQHQNLKREAGEEPTLAAEQARCAVCEKPFTPPASGGELCARCSRV